MSKTKSSKMVRKLHLINEESLQRAYQGAIDRRMALRSRLGNWRWIGAGAALYAVERAALAEMCDRSYARAMGR